MVFKSKLYIPKEGKLQMSYDSFEPDLDKIYALASGIRVGLKHHHIPYRWSDCHQLFRVTIIPENSYLESSNLVTQSAKKGRLEQAMIDFRSDYE